MQVNSQYAWGLLQTDPDSHDNGCMTNRVRRKTFLRQWRRIKPGRTLERVAEHIGISQPQLGRIERGEQPYNQDLLEALAELYECDVPDLLWRNPEDPDGLWLTWKKAKPGQRRQIAEIAATLIKDGTNG